MKERYIIGVIVGLLSTALLYAKIRYENNKIKFQQKKQSFIKQKPTAIITEKTQSLTRETFNNSAKQKKPHTLFKKAPAPKEAFNYENKSSKKTMAESNNKLSTHINKPAVKKPFFISAKLTSVSNTYESGTPEHRASTLVSVSLAYKTKKYSSYLTVGGTQEHTQRKLLDYNNTSLGVSRRLIKINHNASYNYGTSGIIATSNDDKRYTSLLGGLSAFSSLKQKVTLLRVPIDLAYTISFSRYIHKFTRTAFDQPNTKQSLTSSFSISKTLAKKFDLYFGAGLSLNQTYQNTVLEYFNFTQSLSYTVKKKTSLSVGLTNAANALKPDGKQNIALYNERSSTIFGSVQHTF